MSEVADEQKPFAQTAILDNSRWSRLQMCKKVAMKARKIRNLIGPQVRRLRSAKSWSQECLMLKLQDLGWNICRQRIARIEACEAWVSDFEMLLIATALSVEMKDLFPKIEPGKQPLYAAISGLLSGQVKSLMSPEDILLDRSVRCCQPIDVETDKQGEQPSH